MNQEIFDNLWELADRWSDWADDEKDIGAAYAYQQCANQMTEILGPRCFA